VVPSVVSDESVLTEEWVGGSTPNMVKVGAVSHCKVEGNPTTYYSDYKCVRAIKNASVSNVAGRRLSMTRLILYSHLPRAKHWG